MAALIKKYLLTRTAEELRLDIEGLAHATTRGVLVING